MNSHNSSFDEHHVLHELKHFLPAQAPLKDFIHHNTLHAFQNLKFFDATRSASEIFGYKVSLKLEEFRERYKTGSIPDNILEKAITDRKGSAALKEWKEKVVNQKYDTQTSPRIGTLRANWKRQYRIDLDSLVHPILFRVLCSYLDQGISIWRFPVKEKSLLASLREMERNSFTSIFRNERAKELLLKSSCEIADLLKILVGDESLYPSYFYDQQFAHQGWSGMVSAVEDFPNTLLDEKKLSIHDLIVFELLLEIDALDSHFGKAEWAPLAQSLKAKPEDVFAEVAHTELSEVLLLWQKAFEWSYYDEVLAGFKVEK